MQKINPGILAIIVTAQFFCTSLWFAGNVVLPDLVSGFHIPAGTAGHILAAVQFGFISGTLVYSLLLIADRFKPAAVFCCSALLAALANLLMIFFKTEMTAMLALRFFTGFFLAGIYPVGMKIAADHFKDGLGKALGFLVGALVLGTALPHLLKNFTAYLPWDMVLYLTSALAITGGMMMLFVPTRASASSANALNYAAVLRNFKIKPFFKAAMGYFGHMWELYTLWAFVPFILQTYKELHPGIDLNIPFVSFLIIAGGAMACVAGGYLSKYFTVQRTAFTALLLSGLCCLLSPLAFQLPHYAFIAFLLFWGLVVIADSPLFSTMVARHAIPELKGTAITFVTCIGFSITIASIELLNYVSASADPRYIFMILAAGPVTGLICMLPLRDRRDA
jgi:MFS family permease